MPGYTTYKDDELMQLLSKSDAQAFTEIYNRYWEKLLAIGYYYLHDKQGAEDIVQEVMTGLWKRRNNGVIHSLNAYLATAVKFAVFKAITREKKKREAVKALVVPKHYNETEEKLEAKFLQQLLQRTIEGFPEKTRLIFSCREEEFRITE